MQEVVKDLEDDKEKMKKENKELKNQIKKFKRAKTGQGAIEVRLENSKPENFQVIRKTFLFSLLKVFLFSLNRIC